MKNHARILVVLLGSASGGFVSSACITGGPKCEEAEERSINVSLSLAESEVGGLSPETSEEDCKILCEELTREEAKANDYRLDGVTSCSFVIDAAGETAGTLTCSARASEGGCGGGYIEPISVGGAGGAGGAGGSVP